MKINFHKQSNPSGKTFTASEVRDASHKYAYEGIGDDLIDILHAYADMLAEREETLSVPMNLRVALDFADNPRPYHSLACPADTNGELYRALKVLAAAYRAAHSAQAQPPVAQAQSGEGVMDESKTSAWIEYYLNAVSRLTRIHELDVYWAFEGGWDAALEAVLPDGRDAKDWYAHTRTSDRFTIEIIGGRLVQDDDGPWVLRNVVNTAIDAAMKDTKHD